MKKIYAEQLEILLKQIRELERQHPKAKVFYDVERDGIQVLYWMKIVSLSGAVTCMLCRGLIEEGKE